ncbi:MAG TPA: hypothetical protein VNM48_04685 [Chloroflexota bacterium]|nr:hypothetical protein [Chloroflexota bacterium]
MLDYAANGTAYWQPGKLQASFEATCVRMERDPEEELRGLIGPVEDPAGFWQRAEDNLREGRLRLLFVADRIPAELRRIVESLNPQMERTEVLAVEITQYIGEGLSALVPRVVGQQVWRTPPRGGQVTWTVQMVLDKLTAEFGAAAAAAARRLHEGALERDRDIQVRLGKGAKVGNFSLTYPFGGERRTLAYVETNGRLTTLDYGGWVTHPAFAHEAEREELAGRVGRLPGVAAQLAAGRTSL